MGASITRFLVRNLVAMRAVLDHHNTTCPDPATAILLNPVDHGLIGWDVLWGVPVIADDRVPVKRVRIDCSASAWRADEELAFLVSQAEADEDVDSAPA